MRRPWAFTINQFLVCTVGNYTRTMELTTTHHAILKSMAQKYPLDADYAAMLARYAPAHQQFMGAYTKRNVEYGLMQGATLGLKQQLTALRAKAQLWSSMVKAAGFERSSSEYEALFPRGLKPFSNGATDDRIAHVSALAKSMIPYPVLDPVRLQVEAYYTLIYGTRSQQLAYKGNVKLQSILAEEQRKNVMKEQYRNAGRLMEKFADTPGQIATFFNIQVLRKR